MKQKTILISILIILILFGIFARLISLNNDYTAEETEFTRAASALKNTGHPIFYQSQLHSDKLGLWHPPMYIFLLSVVFLFIENEISARLINIIFSLLTSILIYMFCTSLLTFNKDNKYNKENKEKGKIIGLISSAFFLFNYYILSSSVLIDIDALSMFFVFLFVFSILKHQQTKSNLFILIAIISLFFSIWNRYPIAFLVYVGIGLYYLFNKELRKDFAKYFLVGLISGLLFLLSWGIYSTIIEPGTFFSFLSHNVSLGTEQLSNPSIYILSFLLNISQFIRLFTFPATILMLLSYFYLIPKKKEKGKRSKIINILAIYTLIIITFFLFVPRPAFGYPRYFLSIFPGISILIGILIYETINNKQTNNQLSKKEILILIISFIISIILLLLLTPQPTIYYSKGLIQSTNIPDFLFNLFATLPLLFVLFTKRSLRRIAIIVLLALVLSYSLYFDYKFITYESHIKEVGLYIHERTNENSVVIVPNAVGHYTQRKFYNNDNNKPRLDFSYSYLNEYFTKSLDNRNMNDPFFWPNEEGIYSGLYLPGILTEDLNNIEYVVKYYEVNEEGVELEKRMGEFYIYKINNL